MPGTTSLPFAFGSELVRYEWGEAPFPLAYRLMRELKAPLQEHFGEVTKAEFVAYAPQNDEENDISGELKVVIIPPTTLPLSIRVFHPWNTSPSPIPLIRSTLSPCRVLASPPTPSLVLPVSSPSHPASNA
jgi:hypothetical protein